MNPAWLKEVEAGVRAKGPQEMGPGDCLPKTQLYAKAKAEVYGVRPGQCWKVKVRG